MRKMYTTKRLLGSVACAAVMFGALPAAIAQDGPELVEELPLEGDDAGNNGNQVAVGETGEIELHVKELEITKVLQLLSIQSQRNIIASRSVENANVSADLYGVSFEDALTAILKPNGFGYIEEGNFIYVMTTAEIEEREDQNRKLKTIIHRLDYLRADEAAGFVTPMLSDNGSITASGNVEDGIDASSDNAGADNYSGPPTLVIRDYEDKVEEITGLLEQLDEQPKQVIIEATVLRATLTENNQFGVDFSLFSDLTGSSPLSIIDDAISGAATSADTFTGAVSSVGDVASQSGGVKLGFVAGDAAVFVSALDSVTDTTLIATPKTTVLDRNRASILVGEKIAYLSTTVTETSETQTVEFLEVGTQLNVRPFVASDGKVRLELRPSVSDATIRTIGSTSAPDESTVEMITNVIVESGQTIVLGGLFTDDTTVSRSQVPGLGSVPILGAAFQGQDDTVGRSEVIFLVKATVDENISLSNQLGEEGMDRVNTARLAEREGTLPWSRSKLTAAHMVNARKHYDQALTLTGEARDEKMEDALFCVNMALHMNPSMVDALRLKEQITGEDAFIKYEESLVTDTYDTVLLDGELKALGVPELEPLQTNVTEAPDAGQAVEPEPLPGFDVFGQAADEPQAPEEADAAEHAPAPVADAQENEQQLQAQADAAWLEAALADEEQAQAPAEAAEEDWAEQAENAAAWFEQTAGVEPGENTDDPTQVFGVELVEEAAEAPAEAAAAQQAGVKAQAGLEQEPGSKAEADAEVEAAAADPQWRELTTAELLQQAAEATEAELDAAETQKAQETAEADAEAGEPNGDDAQTQEAAEQTAEADADETADADESTDDATASAEADEADEAAEADGNETAQAETETDETVAEETAEAPAETDNTTTQVQTETD